MPLTGIKIHSVLVDKSIKGEPFTTLEGSVLHLTGEELTIRDCLKGYPSGLKMKDFYKETGNSKPDQRKK